MAAGPADFGVNFAEQLDEAMYVVDEQRRIRSWNRAAERLTGWSAGQALGRPCAELLRHTDGTGLALCETSCPLLATLSDGMPRDAEAFLRHRRGPRVSVELHTAALRAASGSVVGAVQLFHAGHRRRETEVRLEELRRLSHLDALTGVANRRHFDLSLAAKLRDLGNLGARFGLLIADVDAFKEINDRLGHAVGDRVLRDVARALALGVRANDIVARIGGDEFGVLLPWVDEAEIARLAERLRSDVERLAVTARGGVVCPKLSLGGALAVPEEESEELFERADRALYRSKREGRNRFVLGR